ncbi:MAG: hypothetical protein HY647_09825, partial [Acidobacteria bacterium]|nr:hypothetical protein [Acidobacteriota bacterium]
MRSNFTIREFRACLWLATGTLFLLAAISIPARAQGTITTIAGTGNGTFSGDGGPATQAALWFPNAVVRDTSGNLYIADTNNHRIRKISTSSVITTVAGGGPVSPGDGLPATLASLSAWGVAVDRNGNLYIADFDNARIRFVNSSGVILTLAGTGTSGFSGDGGLATSAKLNGPVAVTVDSSGNVYIADLWNCRIRKVDSTGIITTIAGNGTCGYSGDNGPATSASFNYPRGLALDGAGNLYISESDADGNYSRVRKVDPTGIITTIAGNGSFGFHGDGGPAVQATLYFARGLAMDGSGNLYIADYRNQRIRRVDTKGIITTVAGNGTSGFSGDGGLATNATLNFPTAVTVDTSGNLYIADSFNNRIRKVAGLPTTYYFAHLALGGGWQTTLTYVNYSPQTVTCVTKFYSDSGYPLRPTFGGVADASRTDTLGPGRSIHIESTENLNSAEVRGWAQAECNGPIKAS